MEQSSWSSSASVEVPGPRAEHPGASWTLCHSSWILWASLGIGVGTSSAPVPAWPICFFPRSPLLCPHVFSITPSPPPGSWDTVSVLARELQEVLLSGGDGAWDEVGWGSGEVPQPDQHWLIPYSQGHCAGITHHSQLPSLPAFTPCSCQSLDFHPSARHVLRSGPKPLSSSQVLVGKAQPCQGQASPSSAPAQPRVVSVTFPWLPHLLAQDPCHQPGTQPEGVHGLWAPAWPQPWETVPVQDRGAAEP